MKCACSHGPAAPSHHEPVHPANAINRPLAAQEHTQDPSCDQDSNDKKMKRADFNPLAQHHVAHGDHERHCGPARWEDQYKNRSNRNECNPERAKRDHSAVRMRWLETVNCADTMLMLPRGRDCSTGEGV